MRCIAAILMASALAASGSALAQRGALGGLGQAMQDIGRQNQEHDDQLELMRQQHQLEMQRIEREHALRLAEQEQIRKRNRERAESDRTRAEQAELLRRTNEAWNADVAKKQAEDARAADLEKLEKAHPNWTTTVKSKRFAKWEKNQPASIRDLGSSERVSDAILMLDLFKRDTRKRQK